MGEAFPHTQVVIEAVCQVDSKVSKHLNKFKSSRFVLLYSTMRSTVADVFRKEGILGFYQGFSALLLREVPANFFYFGGYEGMKNILRSPEEVEDSDLTAWKLIISGGVGGMSFWASIYPIDVLKTKLQVC